MKILNTKFNGLKILKDTNYYDPRGYFREILKKNYFSKKKFIFWCMSKSKRNVLRGLHLQTKFPQDKLVSVIKGKIFDVVVDLRKKSKTFGKSFSIVLSENNCKSLYIPEGFAHAYYSFSKINVIYYKLSNYYLPECQDGILWNDKILKFKWPSKNPIISPKDKKLRTFADFKTVYKGL